MIGPDSKHNNPSAGCPECLEAAFAEALRQTAGGDHAHQAVQFLSLLASLITDFTPRGDLLLSPTFLARVLAAGQNFARIGRGIGLEGDQLFTLACRLRDLIRASPAVDGGLVAPETGDAFPVAFDTFLRGVAVESAHLEAAALQKKLREANRFVLQERRRYYSIFKRMAEPAFIIDRELRLLESNRAFEQMFHLRGKGHIGKSCYDVLGEEFRAACGLQDFLHALPAGGGVELDLHVQGEPRSIIVNGTFLGDINHEATGGIVILQDITARRAAERALRQRERQYRSLIENVPDATWRADQDGDFAFVSPNGETIYGYPAADMLAKGGVRRQAIHPDDIDLVRNAYTRFFVSHLPTDSALRQWLIGPSGEGEANEVYDVTFRFRREGGTWVWLRERASCLDEQDGRWYADGVTSDVTALKVAEAELERHHFRLAELVDERTAELRLANQQLKKEIAVRRQTEQALVDLSTRLANSNQELDQFAHVASHELKEPLMLIMAFCDRLIKRYATELDDKGQEYLRRIGAAAEHMRQLIESFLSLSQVTSRARPYEEIDLTDLVHEVLQSLEERISECHARIEIENLGRLGGDRLQIRQLFQNIIANALKYRKPDSQPRVVLRGEVVNDAYYQIQIQDNGIGFDPRDAERIFRPMERLHSRRDYEGTGMGLTTCQKIVARHGGEIRAQGQPGEGATFIIRLPVSLVR